MITKLCSSCKLTLPVEAFYTSGKRGHHHCCKPCTAEEVKRYRGNNLEKLRARSRAWYYRNKERAADNCKKWRAANPGATPAMWAKWYAANRVRVLASKDKAYSAAKVRERQARKLMATPAWSNSFFVEEAYDLAALRRKITGGKWVVDHVVPLKSRLVCGLHAHTNIRVTTHAVNASKGNRWWPDMPDLSAAIGGR